MNREWMRQKLEEFAELAKRYEQTIAPDEYIGNETLRGQLYRAEPTARKILEALDPDLAERLDLGAMAGEAIAVRLVDQALGILSDMDEWAANLGTNAPTLAADQFSSLDLAGSANTLGKHALSNGCQRSSQRHMRPYPNEDRANRHLRRRPDEPGV